MEIRNIFTNYNEGGNNYILRADSKNRWCGFNKNTIDKLRNKYDLAFNIVIWGTKSENDYYCIPFSALEHLFTAEHMTTGKIAEQGNQRWTAIIENHIFKMHANSMFAVNIERFYSKIEPSQLKTYEDLDKAYDVDYTIEDAKANVNIRLAQSGFRKSVLGNFQSRCCISGIYESSMLVASHIVPWSKNKNYRSDPANGLCLFVEYDAYFDKGYISIDEKLNVIIAEKVQFFSEKLRARINSLRGKKIEPPIIHKIKNEYIEYHRNHILNNFEI